MTTTENILKTLGYFDLFHYPLTKEEIYLFHPDDSPQPVIDNALGELLNNRFVFRLDEFYSLSNDLLLAGRRLKGNHSAVKQMKTARRVARLLSKFPFTKGVAVSGSLSKNFASEETDIDFFIVTDANRLWISRTFMHLYKKLTFLTGRQNWYCMNYYVDEAELEIEEKNIFTAMEIVTLVPMQGRSALDHFIEGNEWTKKYFPVSHTMTPSVPEIKKGFFRKLIEKIFSGGFGNYMDQWLMNITAKRWKKKTEKHRLNSKGFNMGMVVGRHCSKPDPKNFQDKLLEQYQAKLQQLMKLHHKTTSVVL